MFLAGLLLTITVVIGGFVAAEIIFNNLNGHFFWRAFLPAAIRLTILPNDEIKLDGYEILNEYGAFMLYGSFVLLPLIALNFIGFIHIF